VFLDESGFTRVSALKRTWAPVGQTPMVKTSISKKGRINLIGSLAQPLKRAARPRRATFIVSPGWRTIRLSLGMHRHTVTGNEINMALKQLLKIINGPIVLIWDQHSIHRHPMNKELIAKQSGPLRGHGRLHVFELPAAAPELNPAEGLWSQIDEYLAGTAPKTIDELTINVRNGAMRTRNNKTRLWACLAQSELPWDV